MRILLMSILIVRNITISMALQTTTKPILKKIGTLFNYLITIYSNIRPSYSLM